MTRWLVDGSNVVGARPDGWWRDRARARARLVGELAALVEAGDAVTVVLEGRRPGDTDLGDGVHGGVVVRWARRRGRDAADDRLVELLDDDADPRSLSVVTSDRALARRAQARGAAVVGAGAFRDLLGRHGRAEQGVHRRGVSRRESTRMAGDSGPESGVKGVVEDVKGKAKDLVGSATGNEDLEREGEAQQAKADAQRDVASKEAEAEKSRAEAEAQEAQQRANQ